jgi:hypothetical protein
VRLRCKALGCVCDDLLQGCIHCGTDIYTGFITRDASWFRYFYRLQWKWDAARHYRRHECAVCGQTMLLTEDSCCSEKCYKEWIPF